MELNHNEECVMVLVMVMLVLPTGIGRRMARTTLLLSSVIVAD